MSLTFLDKNLAQRYRCGLRLDGRPLDNIYLRALLDMQKRSIILEVVKLCERTPPPPPATVTEQEEGGPWVITPEDFNPPSGQSTLTILTSQPTVDHGLW